jgi:hypothetical protein
VYDGTNAPVQPTGSVSASTITPSAAESFGLGPVEINGVTYTGIQECSIDLGTTLFEQSDQSDPYDTFKGVKSLDPMVMLNGVNPSVWTTYGNIGTALSALNIFLRARNLDASGGAAYVANATTSHIKLAATKGIILPDRSSGGDNNAVDTAFKIGLVAPDTSTDPLTLATSQAIT